MVEDVPALVALVPVAGCEDCGIFELGVVVCWPDVEGVVALWSGEVVDCVVDCVVD